MAIRTGELVERSSQPRVVGDTGGYRAPGETTNTGARRVALVLLHLDHGILPEVVSKPLADDGFVVHACGSFEALLDSARAVRSVFSSPVIVVATYWRTEFVELRPEGRAEIAELGRFASRWSRREEQSARPAEVIENRPPGGGRCVVRFVHNHQVE